MKLIYTHNTIILLGLLVFVMPIIAQQLPRTLSAIDAELASICEENSSPYWKKVFSKDDSNISSPGGWSQEELTKSLFSRSTKQAVGSFWNDVKRK